MNGCIKVWENASGDECNLIFEIFMCCGEKTRTRIHNSLFAVKPVWWNLKIKASDWTSLFKIFFLKDRSRRKRVFSWALPLFFHLFFSYPFTKHPIFFCIMLKTLHWPIFYMTEGSKTGEPGSARCNFTCGCLADAAAHVQSRVAGWGLAANNRSTWLDWASAKSAAGPLEGAERRNNKTGPDQTPPWPPSQLRRRTLQLSCALCRRDGKMRRAGAQLALVNTPPLN